jgi:putative RecB family exonuclease
MITDNHHLRPQRTPTPGERQQAITGRDYISYSEVASYQRCPLQWKFRYVDDAEPEQISAALILGSGVHAAIEYHFQQLMQAGEVPAIDDLLQVFDTCWGKEAQQLPVTFPKGQDRDTIRVTAERMIQQFLESPHAIPDGQLVGIEENFRVVLADDLPTLLGRIDVVTWDGNELLITDYKTARSMWSPTTAQENAEQLMLYSAGMQDLAKTLSDDAKIALRFVIVTKTKSVKIESLPVKLENDRLNRTRVTVRNVVASMQQASRAGTIYPSPSQFNCATCPYKQRCEGWHH